MSDTATKEARLLPVPPDFSPANQSAIAYTMGMLNKQYEQLYEITSELTVEQLSWQPGPGRNTIGMLLVHIADAEIFWLQVAPYNPVKEEVDPKISEKLGFDVSVVGMPMKDGATAPEALADKDITFYHGLLRKTQEITHETLCHWLDTHLEKTYEMQEMTFSYGWTLYHVFEHLCQHVGQIRAIKNLLPDN